MTDEQCENGNQHKNGACVLNANATAPAPADAPLSTGNAPSACGENVAGGVGVSGVASSTGVAIYSGKRLETAKKKSNAYGVREIFIERRVLELPRELFNEAAKPPYAHLLAMTELGKMLFFALEKVGLNPLFRAAIDERPIPFLGIEIDVVSTAKQKNSVCDSAQVSKPEENF